MAKDIGGSKGSLHMTRLVLPESLEPQRSEMEGSLASAQMTLNLFAIKNGWGKLMEKPFINQAEIYDERIKYKQAVVNFLGMDPAAEFPETYSACLENNVLFMVSPALYSEGYPDGVEKNSYTKLITHEMAHRLHIRILGGDENAMGPVWFYEGFAVYAAGQFEDSPLKLDPSEIRGIIADPKRGSYKKYGAVFRCFLQKTSLREMIRHATDNGFWEKLAGT